MGAAQGDRHARQREDCANADHAKPSRRAAADVGVELVGVVSEHQGRVEGLGLDRDETLDDLLRGRLSNPRRNNRRH